MRILLSGGTGLIGRALCQHWQQQGHELWVLSRKPQRVAHLCSGARGVGQLQALDAVPPLDAVVNLAGAPIADRPWTAARRQVLWRSRIDLTRALVDWLGRRATPPPVLVSGSAVGWYGDCGEQALAEGSPPGRPDFGSRLCAAWEHEAERARQWGMRVALVRTAPVLAPQHGMLARLLPAFRMGLGGRLGSGRQWMPWIHLDDQVALIDRLLHDPACSGPYNACAPGAVRNAHFAQALARALHRPALLPVPGWALRLALGEMSVLLLGSQRVVPARAEQAAFPWQHPALPGALAHLLLQR
ncbi:TIGR01777 family oxidoreductase [Pulveribacter suum]|uniref:TIGR01777 family protein n=1 Tax=Pulveribacter suum TaxID=2116657 RepID=A0A2P1NKS0_9BURK|nr:TIGR01777 family oxidoreductase [Pulveribacter suum]AVP57616.1 TIGR01777 family protein [Pulveribacter suum]